MTLDTLSFSNSLQQAGVPRKQAEAHAQLTRDVVFNDLIEKEKFEQEMVKLGKQITSLEEKLDQKLTQLDLRITVKLGGMITVATGLVIAAQKFL